MKGGGLREGVYWLMSLPYLELREISSSVFSSPSTSFFSLFVVFPLPTVVENVGVYHLCRVFFP